MNSLIKCTAGSFLGVFLALPTAVALATEWDLSGLPSYEPQQHVSGTLRMGGAQFAGLVKVWEDAFRRFQPDVTFANELPSSDAAQAGMILGTADIAPSGREPSLEEVLGFTEKYGYKVTPIIVGTGAWKAPGGSSWSPVVFVSHDNPLTQLTMSQVDGIFGAERTGGYDENSKVWERRFARGPERNLRTWGQLGLKGEWADKPIQTYGYSPTGMRHFFELRVFHGGDKWNPNYREYAETGTEMVVEGSGAGSHDMLLTLSHNKYGIGWSGLGHAESVPGLKPVALAPEGGGRYFEPSERNMQTHVYPLSRNVFLYLNLTPGKPLDPKIREFLLFVLSRQGQDLLAHNGLHLPLTPETLLAQRRRLGDTSLQAGPEEPAVAPANSGKSIWTQNVTGLRKQHGSVGGYTKRWDLSDLPHYVPKRQLTGTIRIWGNNYLNDGPLGGYWREAFKKYQPGLTLEYHLPTGAIAVSAVCVGVADLGMNYKATLSDRLIFEQTFHHPMTEIAAATGSYDVYGWGPAGIIVVNKDNPLTEITVEQIDGVFGSARNGGYEGSVWHTEYPYSRGPERNIRTWGQLGLTGEWADKAIHVGGQNLSSGAMLQFSNEVLGGSLQFADGYKTYTNYVTADGKMYSWSEQVLHEVERDRYAMYYASPMTLSPGMKALAIRPRNGGSYVQRTLETVRDNSYPLTHHSYFYLNRDPGKPVDPKLDEFLHFVLSQEGQEWVQREGRYLPLTAEVVRAQLKKLE